MIKPGKCMVATKFATQLQYNLACKMIASARLADSTSSDKSVGALLSVRSVLADS